MSDHIADKKETMVCMNIGPDMCWVDKAIVPFEIFQIVSSELSDYSENTIARQGNVLKLGSVVSGTLGNVGEGFISGVALASGHAVAVTGDPLVHVNKLPVVRHDDLALMNTEP
jgi:hypothetical protein